MDCCQRDCKAKAAVVATIQRLVCKTGVVSDDYIEEVDKAFCPEHTPGTEVRASATPGGRGFVTQMISCKKL